MSDPDLIDREAWPPAFVDWYNAHVEEGERAIAAIRAAPRAATEPSLTRERLAAALYEALNATRVGPDYPESLALADAILAALAEAPTCVCPEPGWLGGGTVNCPVHGSWTHTSAYTHSEVRVEPFDNGGVFRARGGSR